MPRPVAAIVVDRKGRMAIYRLKAGAKGTGRQLHVFRDRGYGELACVTELARTATYAGFDLYRCPRCRAALCRGGCPA